MRYIAKQWKGWKCDNSEKNERIGKKMSCHDDNWLNR